MTALVAATCLGLAAALALPGPPRAWRHVAPLAPSPGRSDDWMRRWRLVWAVLAGTAAGTFLSGPLAAPGAVAAAVAVWVLIGRSEPASARRRRDAARHDLPHLVGLLADALRAGRSPTDALALVTAALPGPAADRLAPVVPRLRLGVDVRTVWEGLAADAALAPWAGCSPAPRRPAPR